MLDDSIEAKCLVKAQARTGVEMEALVGVSMALATLWDMVKYLEKDRDGQYPTTRIGDVRVLSKIKGELDKSEKGR
jgi:cyclic pyranopterin phosphate synthase